MALVKFNSVRAEKLGTALSAISPKAETFGYLTGLVQDVKRCVTSNLKTDENLTDSDAKLVDEMLESLDHIEGNLSCFMSEAIQDNNPSGE